MIKINVLLLIATLSFPCFGQSDLGLKNNNEGFNHLSNELIKKEIGSFIIANEKISDTLIPLKEIKIFNCTPSYIVFNSSNVFTTKKLITVKSTTFDDGQQGAIGQVDTNLNEVLINGKYAWGAINRSPKRMIYEIRFIKYKTKIDIPNSAFEDLFEPVFCETDVRKRNKIESSMRAYESNDGSRTYLYMLNGYDKNRYEVTLIFEGTRYLGRVIDHVN